MTGVGLQVSGSYAKDSGPYTNIVFEPGNNAVSTTTCAQITNVAGTKGIHGLSCIANAVPAVAIYLDASNNIIEDVDITGFDTGVLVGSKGTAQSNVLRKISGSIMNIQVIQISSGNPVTNLSIMGVNNVGGPAQLAIQDSVTGTNISDAFVAMYVLGQSANGGYSRFATSPNSSNLNVPTWVVGQLRPQGLCSNGSLYSCHSCGTTVAALWGCKNGSWAAIK